MQPDDPALIPPMPPTRPALLRCRRCGRPLHDPESRILGLGRNCRGPEDPTQVLPGEQDALF
ncbi:DUF6011 domain-containing protein [Kitasatospora sp. NPDC002040]|uniref:DUF6011 domain-containing protein n=1 Tax=Kitasatospora sp. NPDC002040 TaxID=3154661 RepID=UPI0033179BE7